MTSILPATASADGPIHDQVVALVRQHEVEQFYYAEARLIDERDFAAWLNLFTDDAGY